MRFAFASLAAGAAICGPLFAQARVRTPAQACANTPCGEELVYIGTQGSGPGQGIFAARFDPHSGRLMPIGLAAEVDRPTWIVPHPKLPILYSVSEVGNDGRSEGGVFVLRADRGTGLLRVIGKVNSGGGGATHLSLDLPSRTILVANYGTGQVAALPVLGDATVAPPASVQSDQGSGPSPRQKGPHAHGVVLDPSRRFALVADLGADRIFIYRYARATHRLTPFASETVPAGSGPRHLAFHPGGRFLFLVNELAAEIRSYRWDAQRGRLRLVQATPTTLDPAKADRNKGAEVRASSDGRFVYMSNRGEDSLVAYAVDQRSGALREVQRIAAGGQTPWSFAIHPGGRWLLVTNQASNAVNLFQRDPATGRLTATAETLTITRPVSVAFLR
jgi:6-phosphogluconolactonase